MGQEAIVIPIIIDPKAGVAGLKALGEQAAKTNKELDQGATTGGKFADSMKNMAKNALALLGAMNLAGHATKFLVNAFLDSIASMGRMKTATDLLAEAQQKAVESTRNEVVGLQTLYAVAKDTTLSYNQREQAIEQLNKAMPGHLNNLTLETIGTQAVADAIQNVIDNMVRAEKLKNVIKQISELENSLDALRKIDAATGDGLFSLLGKLPKKSIEDVLQMIAALRKEAVALQGQGFQNKGMSDLITGATGVKVPKITVQPNKVTVDISHAGDIDMIGGEDGASLGPDSAKAKVNLDVKYIGEPVKEVSILTDELQRQADLITQFLTPAFDSFIDAVMDGQNPLQSFFQAIGQSIRQLIKQLMAAVVQAGILSLLTGGVGNAAKGGLSFGGALKQIFGFAEGGLTTGPVSAVIGEGRGTNAYNPEVVAPLDKLKNFFRDMLPQNRGFMAGSNMGTAGMALNIPTQVMLYGDGRSLNGVLTLEQLSQQRNG